VKGKRTYLSLAGLVATLIVSILARHGYDAQGFEATIADLIALGFAAAAAYFRSVAQPAKEKSDA
jgi:uncharacterized membrane protein (DUF441 family)